MEPTTNLTLKWILVDVSYCLVLKRLRIPRLNYAVAAVMLQMLILSLIDGVLFGTVRVSACSDRKRVCLAHGHYIIGRCDLVFTIIFG